MKYIATKNDIKKHKRPHGVRPKNREPPFPDGFNDVQSMIYEDIRSIISKKDITTPDLERLFLIEGDLYTEKVALLRAIDYYCRFRQIGIVNISNSTASGDFIPDAQTLSSMLCLKYSNTDKNPQLNKERLLQNGCYEKYKRTRVINIYNGNAIFSKYLRCLDSFLRELHETDIMFGGLVIIIYSDHRGILATPKSDKVTDNGTLYDDESLLSLFKVHRMELFNFDKSTTLSQEAHSIRSMLTEGDPVDFTNLPKQWSTKHIFKDPVALCHKIYGDLEFRFNDSYLSWLKILYKTRKIACCTNESVDYYNYTCLMRFSTEAHESFNVGFFLSERALLGRSFLYNRETGQVEKYIPLKRFTPLVLMQTVNYYTADGEYVSLKQLNKGTSLVFLDYSPETTMMKCEVLSMQDNFTPKNLSGREPPKLIAFLKPITIYGAMKMEGEDTIDYPPFFPVMLGFATTIYRIQGCPQIEKVGVDLYDLNNSIGIITNLPIELNRVAYVGFNAVNSDDDVYIVPPHVPNLDEMVENALYSE